MRVILSLIGLHVKKIKKSSLAQSYDLQNGQKKFLIKKGEAKKTAIFGAKN
jgi:hypothetical protein